MRRYHQLLIIATLLLLAPAAQTQEAGYGLLWRDYVGDVISISANGSYIAAGHHHTVYLFDWEGNFLWDYETDGNVRDDVSISADGSYIAAGSYDKKMYFFNREGELLWNYETGDSIYDVSISADGSYIAAGVATGSNGNKVYLFNREGELLWSYETGASQYRILDVSISANGSCIAAGSKDNKVYLFNREGELLWSYEAGTDVKGISFSSDGSYMAVIADGGYFFACIELLSQQFSFGTLHNL